MRFSGRLAVPVRGSVPRVGAPPEDDGRFADDAPPAPRGGLGGDD